MKKNLFFTTLTMLTFITTYSIPKEIPQLKNNHLVRQRAYRNINNLITISNKTPQNLTLILNYINQNEPYTDRHQVNANTTAIIEKQQAPNIELQSITAGEHTLHTNLASLTQIIIRDGSISTRN